MFANQDARLTITPESHYSVILARTVRLGDQVATFPI
jgi:hypothetical protein